MSTPSLLLPPDQASYQPTWGHTVVSAQLEGGASRFRADQLGASFQLVVQWTMNAANYNYLVAFFRTATNFGALPFLIDLILDTAALQTYTAHFVADTFNLISQQGDTYVVGATLEITPDSSYAVNDAAIIAAGPDV